MDKYIDMEHHNNSTNCSLCRFFLSGLLYCRNNLLYIYFFTYVRHDKKKNKKHITCQTNANYNITFPLAEVIVRQINTTLRHYQCRYKFLCYLSRVFLKTHEITTRLTIYHTYLFIPCWAMSVTGVQWHVLWITLTTRCHHKALNGQSDVINAIIWGFISLFETYEGSMRIQNIVTRNTDL